LFSKAGYLHLTVTKSQFKLVSGADVLTTYQFNTGTAKVNWEQSHAAGGSGSQAEA
jgi:hypothetical protein